MNTFTKVVAFMTALTLTLVYANTAQADENADRSASMAQRMQRLEDREAIRDLLVTYGRLLDAKDLVGYSKLFAKDGVWEGGIGSAKGPDGIFQMLDTVYSKVEPGQFGSSYHIMSEFLIDVDGDTATSWSRWTWIVEGEDGKPVGQRSGHYEDVLVKENGQWKFTHRLTVTELPTPEKDTEAQLFRTDHRDQN